MSPNKYKEHILVLPEDDANREIADGFTLSLNVKRRAIQVLPPAGGWLEVLSQFEKEEIAEMRKTKKRRMVLLIDFDRKENRLNYVKSKIPSDLRDRVFVLGVFSEPEELKTQNQKSLEAIGEILAKDCPDRTNQFWEDELLAHNKFELERVSSSVNSFLFV